MRKLVLILIAFLAIATLVRAFDTFKHEESLALPELVDEEGRAR